ncbi:hypothetical protein [Mycobacterium neglectum]|jgi:hypothetical protein|uniref:hypothetical protein n=1 Tax=Mycobacterium neglectum TaxID=242737 RepID=UPI000BFEF98A|nr:hypothetical protein [Mycobacterium neglectum]
MEFTGFKRQVGSVAVAAASFAMLVTAAGFAAPIAAAEESDAETWTMPDTESNMLENAVAATYEAAGTENVEIEFAVSGVNQVVYNYANWRVCGQSPSADEEVEVTAEPATVEFEVARPGGCE